MSKGSCYSHTLRSIFFVRFLNVSCFDRGKVSKVVSQINTNLPLFDG